MAEPESTDPDLATDMEGIFKGAFMNQAAEEGEDSLSQQLNLP